jgi:hypothetical protein
MNHPKAACAHPGDPRAGTHRTHRRDTEPVLPWWLTEPAPSPAEIHAELDRARAEFHALVARATQDDLARKVQRHRLDQSATAIPPALRLPHHRTLRVIVKLMSRQPNRVQRGFARAERGETG